METMEVMETVLQQPQKNVITVKDFSLLERLKSKFESLKVKGSTSGHANVNGNKIETMMVLVTPELAQIMIDEANTMNRKVNPINVNLLSKEMSLDKWGFNGDAIRINKYGVISDGQHRLLSIINSGKEQICLIVIGINEDSFETIDVGIKRSSSDIFSIYNIERPTLTSAIVKFIYAFESGKFSANRNTHRNLNNQDIIPYYETLEDLKTSVDFTYNVTKKGQALVPPSTVGGLHYLMSKIDKEKADEFIDKMCVGENLDIDSPITALRNKLIKAKTNDKYKLTNKSMLENIIQAWNFFREGSQCKHIKITSDFEIKMK